MSSSFLCSRLFARKGKKNMSRATRMVSVVDVYELATDMGKEIEKMMDEYGPDIVRDLMPKVIDALELLESFASQNEEENGQLDDLRTRVSQLESEKSVKAAYTIKFEKELEQMEENLRGENRDLIRLVSRLQDENRKLSSTLQEREGSVPEIGPEQDVLILQKLNHLMEQQRTQIRRMEHDLQQKTAECEVSQEQVERLSQANKELQRKKRNVSLQSRLLLEQKAELEAQLQERMRENNVLYDKLGATTKTNEDLMKMKSPTMPNLSSRAMCDADDPDRPRFTMNELRKILFERNELKARVSELLDELEMYRPKRRPPTTSSPEDDAPVQGPINKEPDDAPWKKQESGIRKLFRVLFGDSSGGSSPKSGGGISLPSFKPSCIPDTSRSLPH